MARMIAERIGCHRIRRPKTGKYTMDFSKIDRPFRDEIIKGGEAYLDGLLKIATSADSRASGLAGIFTAAATALTAGVVIAIANAPGADILARLPVLAGGGTAAACFLIAAIFCVRSLQPTSFWLPGCEPTNWEEDVAAGRKLDDCLEERAKHIQDHIDQNAHVIEKNAKLFKWGTRFGIAAPFVGFVAWLTFFSWDRLLLFLSYLTSLFS
jgi:hypothetical protein